LVDINKFAIFTIEIFVPFEEIMESATTPAPATQDAPAAQQQQNSSQAQEFLAEMTKLKNELDLAKKRDAEYAKAMEQLAQFKERESKAAAEYAESQKPKLEQYVARLEASKGSKVDVATLKGLETTFCVPQHKGLFQDLWAAHEASVNAEKKEREKDEIIKKLQQDIAERNKLVNEATKQMRSTSTFVPTSAAAEQERAKQEDDSMRKQVGAVAASAGGEIMCPEPSAAEFALLDGYRQMASVNASRGGSAPGGGLRQSVTAAPDHRNRYDQETGEQALYGMRDEFPHLFGYWVNDLKTQERDLEATGLVQFDAKRSFIDNSKRVDGFA
jgi:hypothetical protein